MKNAVNKQNVSTFLNESEKELFINFFKELEPVFLEKNKGQLITNFYNLLNSIIRNESFLKENFIQSFATAGVDLLENRSSLPSNVILIIDSFDEYQDVYFECKRIKKELNVLGYDIDYGLSGEPYDLKKIA